MSRLVIAPFNKLTGILKKTLILMAMMIYVLMPVDVVPELVFGPLGLLDDAVVLLFGLRYLLKK